MDKKDKKEKSDKKDKINNNSNNSNNLNNLNKNSVLCSTKELDNLYNSKCGINKKKLELELLNRQELEKNPDQDLNLYPILDDPNFNIKIATKKEFNDTRYDGTIYNVEDYAELLSKAEYELLPQQAFVRNFLSFQTPYNSLLLFHGLGSGKTLSAIGVCEEMRDYLTQMGINKRILIVASPNVQDNFRVQLFDERKLKEVDGLWTIPGYIGSKMLKEINPTGMKGIKKEKIIQQIKTLITASYSFQGYLQFSNDIVKKAGSDTLPIEVKIKNLQNNYSDSLIVIDEVHNIRISDDNDNKNVAKNLLFLVTVVTNIRLLLLSATPMFNNYKEILWIINLMNINDKRGIVSITDIFDKLGNWKKDSNGLEIGKELFIRKASGYVSHVRGENPYTFPFRVFPDRFNKDHTFQSLQEYPNYQINGRKIPNNKKIEKICLFLNAIGSYQALGYKYIVGRLRLRAEGYKLTKKSLKRKIPAFNSLKTFGYNDLQLPLEALNIIYPYPNLEKLVKFIPDLKYNEDSEQEIMDISPKKEDKIENNQEEKELEYLDSILHDGPQRNNDKEMKMEIELERSEKESEPFIMELKKPENIEEKLTELKKIKTKKESKSTIPVKSIFKTVDKKEFNGGRNEWKGGDEWKGGEGPESESESESESEAESEAESESEPESESDPESESESNELLIDPRELTGIQGLKRIMTYTDTKTPAIKGQFEYKKGAIHVFQPNEIGNYSVKIKNICDYIVNPQTNEVSEGIILIYSANIDAGLIPMALALEEMGLTRYGDNGLSLFKKAPCTPVDVRTMKPPENKRDFKPARYIMITGDPRISPDNDSDVKAITNNDNIFTKDKNGNIIDISGEKIKVVLISKAGSEGLDFKAIRQVHILEPWYNLNRIEQIIGRAVRNFSHKDIPFVKRNVQIFLYGTILENAEEEAADLYIYRIAELKAIKIGKVTRLLKQTAVDCILNHDQIEFTNNNFEKIEENKNIYQILSDHQRLNHFNIGDIDNSSTCDFMECNFKCLPELDNNDIVLNVDTYNESFMLVNSEKIIKKIKDLMKLRFFYIKSELIQLINYPKSYPLSQIYASLTLIINDKTEYIVDKYGRTGYLINIGEYYLFQPSELNYPNISIYDRSVPLNVTNNSIQFQLKPDVLRDEKEKEFIENNIKDNDLKTIEVEEGKLIIQSMFNNYVLTLKTTKVVRGNNNWYEHCGVVLRKLAKDEKILKGKTEYQRLEILENFVIDHIVDCLLMTERIQLMNYINSEPKLNEIVSIDLIDKFKRFYNKVQKSLALKIIVCKGLTGMVIFNGPSRIDNFHLFILENKIWRIALSEDRKDCEQAILNKYKLKSNLNAIVGFIGFENNKHYMVYKVKDTTNTRSTGFRCDQSGKEKIVKVLEEIINKDIEKDMEKGIKKEGAFELCVKQELLLRCFEFDKLDNKTWFLETESAIINEFEKKEKKK
jgi:hypothetical protein